MALFLNAAGFHCLTFDVRGHGANPPEDLPLSAGEFGCRRARRRSAPLIERPEVTVGADLGPFDGRIGAILAAGADPRVAAVVATSSPAGPYRLTRQTFRLARLPIPDPIAYPLAWLTTRVYLRPRGHVVDDVSAAAAIARYDGPGPAGPWREDTVVPLSHMRPAAAAARAARAGDRDRGRRRDAGRARAASIRGCTRTPGYRADGRAVPDAGPRRPAGSGGGGGARGGRPTPARIPEGEAPFAAVEDGVGRPADACPGRAARRDARAAPTPTQAMPAGPPPPASPIVTRRRDDPVWRAIATKRAIRRFADRPLEPTTSSGSCSAGRRPGSSKNLQRWTFIVCRDRDAPRELAALGPWAGHVAGAAAAVALVTPDPARDRTQPLSVMFDLGQAAENMMLAAWELGIGSVPATVYEHDLARELLGYPADQHCEYLLSFGYPADPDRPHPAAAAGGRRAARRDGPRGALVGARPSAAHCHWNLRAAIPKQTTSQPSRTAAQTHSGREGGAADHHLAQRVGEVGQRDDPGDDLQELRHLVDLEEGARQEHHRELDHRGHAVGRVLGLGERGDDVAEGEERHRAEGHEAGHDQQAAGDLDPEERASRRRR